MKKKILVIVLSILVVIALAAAGVCLYIAGSPQYALKKMIEDVRADGINGLYPHLTEGARETVDGISSAAEESALLGKVTGLISASGYISELKAKLQEVQWEVRDVMKSRNHAAVVLSFQYQDRFKGTIEITMTKEKHTWKIDGISVPIFS